MSNAAETKETTSSAEKRIEGFPEAERVHKPGEVCVLELRAYLQEDGSIEVRWLSNGVAAKAGGSSAGGVARAYEAIAKDAIKGAAMWAKLEGRGEVA